MVHIRSDRLLSPFQGDAQTNNRVLSEEATLVDISRMTAAEIAYFT
jgi:hypothetical protein